MIYRTQFYPTQKHNRHLIRIVSILILSSFLVNEALAKKQTLILNEDETLQVKVIKNGAVRLSVKGDRLQDVMGLEETVSFEKDETHGFLYLRGIDRKQTITLVTEGGVLQELILEPDEKGISNVVFKSKDAVEEEISFQKGERALQSVVQPNLMMPLQQSSFSKSSFQETAIMLIKQLHRGMGSVEELEGVGERHTSHRVFAKPLRHLKTQGMRGIVFEVINDTGTTLNLLEKDFYRLGDYAVAIGKKQLERDEKTLLIVVQRG